MFFILVVRTRYSFVWQVNMLFMLFHCTNRRLWHQYRSAPLQLMEWFRVSEYSLLSPLYHWVLTVIFCIFVGNMKSLEFRIEFTIHIQFYFCINFHLGCSMPDLHHLSDESQCSLHWCFQVIRQICIVFLPKCMGGPTKWDGSGHGTFWVLIVFGTPCIIMH